MTAERRNIDTARFAPNDWNIDLHSSPRHPGPPPEKVFGPPKHTDQTPNVRMYDWMSRDLLGCPRARKLGSTVRINWLFDLLINGRYIWVN